MTNSIEKALKQLRNPEKAQILRRFFKTGKGEYGEGTLFLGVMVPELRNIAKQYKDLPLQKIQKLLLNNHYEHRFIALIILTHQYQENKQKIFNFYLKNTKNINSWGLVDVSAPNIVGNYLLDKDKTILYKLASSNNLWEKRIAIVSTFAFIRKNKLKETIKISEILLKDKHDLIHKAVGWMLRELGKKDQKLLESFLKKHIKKIPRTTLRYSIEKFDKNKRKNYLKK